MRRLLRLLPLPAMALSSAVASGEAITNTFNWSSAAEQAQWIQVISELTGPQGIQYDSSTWHAPGGNYQLLQGTPGFRIKPFDTGRNGVGDVNLYRQFDAAPGKTLSNITFETDARAYSSWGRGIQIWLCYDDGNFDVASALASSGSDQHLIADARNNRNYQGISTVYLRIRIYDLYGFLHAPAPIEPRDYVNGWNTKITAIQSATSAWNLNGSGNWSEVANWSGAVPGSSDDRAIFASVATAPRVVSVDAPKTVGTIDFDNTNAYTIGGVNPLTLNVTLGQAAINVLRGSHTISAPVILNRDTMISTAGSSGLTLTGALTATGRAITKVGAGTAQFENIRAAGLNVNAGIVRIGSKSTANDPSGTSVVNSLSLTYDPGTQLDLTNNSMVVDYTTLGALMDNMKLWLQRGQLTSSTADGAHKLGFGNNTILGKTSFAGRTVDATSVLVMYTYGGDANLDGKVDVGDLGALASNWQQSALWTGGDFDYSGVVNVADLGVLATNWQAGAGLSMNVSFDEALASVGLGGVAVPEPASLGAVLLAALACRRRRGVVPRSYLSAPDDRLISLPKTDSKPLSHKERLP